MFARLAKTVERAVGSSWAFGVAVATILLWAGSGPLFGWSDTWQLVINTSTTIVTFLVVFLIQNTQTRDTEAIHVKLDELIRVSDARNELIAAEAMGEERLFELHEQMVQEKEKSDG